MYLLQKKKIKCFVYLSSCLFRLILIDLDWDNCQLVDGR